MARLPRLQAANAIFHVTNRGVLGAPIYDDDHDRVAFLRIFADVVEREAWVCHSYCLMTNHYHALVWTPRANLASGMHRLNGNYAQSFNRRHRRMGHVFYRRYASVLIQSDAHFVEAVQYIAMNPVRAGAAKTPLDWEWSSYAALIGRAPAPPFLTTSGVLAQFGGDPKATRRRLRAFVERDRLEQLAA